MTTNATANINIKDKMIWLELKFHSFNPEQVLEDLIGIERTFKTFLPVFNRVIWHVAYKVPVHTLITWLLAN